ncbi:hypothetical protein SG34_026440 [Thalassomonas viridans]|uniref:Uncharacterized protein n=1 Tax=Thalassomonas viridans TaxID=137584 RepID=A0AAE9Z1B6_9GAMM|nr:hypothetical protein [Thalassomonas viridans]WDE04810.1 hypothetical protein SG34_026440 [Thalassomonas viridans]
MLKWLTSLLVVMFGFAVILLALGYLLKENEAQTTALKQELDREKAALKEKALKQQAKQEQQPRETFVLEPYEEAPGQPKVIAYPDKEKADDKQVLLASIARVVREYSHCHSEQQCLLFNLDQQEPGCWLAVNSQGAAILAKISALHPGGLGVDACQANSGLKAVCRDSRCRAEAANPAR